MRRWEALAALAVLIIAQPLTVRGYDVEVESDTEFRAYEVRSPATTVFWARRRLVDTLAMRMVQPMYDEQRRQTGPSVQAQLSLRLYRDFGDTCLVDKDACFDATDSGDVGTYQPLARDSVIDMPLAYVEGSNLPAGLQLRAGRQLYWDGIGFARIDGGSASVDPWPWLRIEAVGGIMVDDTSVAGASQMAPQSVPRLDLNREQRELAPYIESPVTTAIAGGGFEAGPIKIVRAGVNFRELWDDHGVVQRRGGLGATSEPIEPLHLQADAVWDLVDFDLVDAQAATELKTGEVTWRLSGLRHVPRFDWGTIWAYFEVAPIWEEKIGAFWQANPKLGIGGAVSGRHADISGEYDDDLGLEGYTSMRFGLLQLGFSGFSWFGDLGPDWGADFDGSRPVLSWLILSGRLSVWRIDDTLRPVMRGVSLSETLGAKFRLTDATLLSSELSHAYSEVSGNRFWVFLFLHLGVWR